MNFRLTQPILGLDLGSSCVKAVSLRKKLTGLEWAGAYQRDWSRTQDLFEWAKEPFSGLKEWLAEHRLATDRVVVSVPLHLISLRTLTLPFQDARKLEKVVPFEIEALLPYSLEEVVVDYQVMDIGDGKSHLLVAAVPRSLMKNYLDQLIRVGVDPESVELDGMALANLARHAFPEPPGEGDRASDDTAVLDIGASKTVVCILRRGQPCFLRTLLWGGRNATAALSEGCGISPAEAEEWKRQAGLMDDGIPHLHQKGVSKIIGQSLDTLVSELVRTFHGYQGQEPTADRATVTELVLYGGGSKLKGLESYLGSELGVRTSTHTPKIASNNGNRWDPALAMSLGLALKGTQTADGSRMNFRKGEFAYGQETSVSATRARYVWIGAFLVAAVAATDLYMKYNIQVNKYQGLKTQVREEFHAMFPEVKNVVDEVQQAKTAVTEMRKKSALFGLDDWSPLQLMAELTRRIPPSVKIEVQDFVIEPGRLRLEAETDSFESVDKIKASLGQFEAFKDVTVSDAKVSADQSRVRFRLTMTVAPKGAG
ncbi:MAG TPA: type II secretion system protein GspL [Nitrospiria bacterium]|nr:type II secretion system protein GspL [Nitrospiria bacterium]